MKITRPYFLAAFLVLLILSAFLYYRWRERQLFSSVWAFIPQNAVLVVESEQPLTELQQWEQQLPWQTLQTLPSFQKLRNRLAYLRQLNPEVENWLTNTPVVSSLHVTAPDDFDFVFYLPLSDQRSKDLFENVLKRFTGSREYRSDSRNFGGFLIKDITHIPSSTRFSYLLHDQVVIGSYTPFLVEDVVRTLHQTSSLHPNEWIARHQAHSLGEEFPHVYLTAAALPRLFQVFTSAVLDSEMRGLAHAALSFELNAKTDANGLAWQGKGNLSQGEKAMDYLATFRGQEATAPACFQLIPNRTAVWQHWSLSDPTQWLARLQQYLAIHEPQTLESRQLLEREYGVSVRSFLNYIGHELVLIIPENAENPADRLLILQTSQPGKTLSFLNDLANAADQKENQQPYEEKFNQAHLRQIHLNELPAALLGNVFSGFPQCFFTSVNNYIIIASSLPTLRQQLTDVRNGNVWKNSRPHPVFSKQAESGSQFFYFADVARAWPLLMQSTSTSWQKWLQAHAGTLRKFDWLSLQAQMPADGEVSVDLKLHYGADATKTPLRNKYFVTHQTTLDTTVHLPPVVVRNHTNQSQEVLVQDAANRLYLVGANGKVLWRKWMEKPITGEVYQVDYLKNNKLQYLFTTQRNLYLLDRNGSPVGNFPVRVPAPTALQTAAVIDYEHNLEYRFLVQDLVGNLYLYNKAGQLLEGWNPLRLGYRLQGPVQHLRVRDKDYLLAVQIDGKVHVLNRRGKDYPGFPLALSHTTNPVFIEAGTDPANTFLTILTDKGEIVRFDLLGQLAGRQQLYRPSKNTFFRMCIDNARQVGWFIARYDEQSISILDRQGNLVFTKEKEPSETYQTQYYDFGAGLRLIALTNLTEDKTEVYHLSGALVGEQALDSGFPVSLLYSDIYNKMLVYTGQGRQVRVVSVKVR